VAFYIAAFLIVWGVALFVAAPLTGGLRARAKRSREELELDHWEHEHGLAVQGLRELEFDREMGKLSDADYESLKASLEGRALQAMAAIQRFKEQDRAADLAVVTVRPKLREAAAIADEIAAMSKPQPPIPIVSGIGNLPPAVTSTRAAITEIGGGRRIKFCPQCGMRTPMAGNFCGECGTPLRGERVATRAS
jgi:cytochrome c-type biogenesis protein CcmI